MCTPESPDCTIFQHFTELPGRVHAPKQVWPDAILCHAIHISIRGSFWKHWNLFGFNLHVFLHDSSPTALTHRKWSQAKGLARNSVGTIQATNPSLIIDAVIQPKCNKKAIHEASRHPLKTNSFKKHSISFNDSMWFNASIVSKETNMNKTTKTWSMPSASVLLFEPRYFWWFATMVC